MDLTNKLLSIKEKIQQVEQDIAVSKGKLQVFNQRLKTEWNCNSIEEANILVNVITNNINNLYSQKEEVLNELHNKYGWTL